MIQVYDNEQYNIERFEQFDWIEVQIMTSWGLVWNIKLNQSQHLRSILIVAIFVIRIH
jgi:hypothetical protein